MRVECINLARREDRFDAFLARAPNLPWAVHRREAVDGSICPHPEWWRQGNGAWGCYRSHLSLIEECLNDGTEEVIIFEDDAIFVPNFEAKYLEYRNALPEGWGMAYLGGQHLYQKRQAPVRINEYVVKPFNVNRTHAYMVRREFMPTLYRHLCATKSWKDRHHIDHHYGALTETRRHQIYAPTEWLVGQAEGKSDVSRKDVPERFWNGTKSVDRDAFVVVLGLHRSGSSCLAGMLHHLGVHMGNSFGGCEADGGYEATELMQMCESGMRFPSTRMKMLASNFKQRFERWARERKKEARAKKTIAGGKYPHLCAFAPMLYEVLGDSMHVVSIERPLDKSIASLIGRSGNKHSSESLEQCQRFLWQGREQFLKTFAGPLHVVQYEDVLKEPERIAKGLAAFLSIEYREEAAAYVRPEKTKYGY